jgi:hypothetical protein
MNVYLTLSLEDGVKAADYFLSILLFKNMGKIAFLQKQ